MEENPFSNPNFLKDIKRSFVPAKLFNQNKYNYNIIDINFKVKKNNATDITLKLSSGEKYEYIYILKNNKEYKITDEDIEMKLE